MSVKEMKSNQMIIALIVAAGLVSLPAFAQDSVEYRSDATVQALGSFDKSSSSDGVRHSTSNSGGVLATYRFFFSRHHGVEVNYGYLRNTHNYGIAGGNLALPVHSHEASAAYVVRFPFRRWTPFALAGAGGLRFDPRNTVGAQAQSRAAFVYGGGADLNLTSRIYLRAQYRGFVYNSPTFDVPTVLNVDRAVHRVVPSVGFGFRF